jgi:hypothetical protein
MDRNDERNDRMLDSNDLSNPARSTAPRDAELIGNEHPRRDAAHLADDRRDDNPADEIGEAVGGISGVLTGAALGSLGGPIGTIIGGIAGAVTGWWAGKAISEAASHVTHDDETYYRTHYESSPNRLADRSYEDVRPAYQLGHLAGRNPEYQGRSFEEVETDLQRGWSSDVSSRHGDWQQVRPYARDAYERGRSGFGMGAVSGASTSASTGASGDADRASLTAAEQRDAGSMSDASSSMSSSRASSTVGSSATGGAVSGTGAPGALAGAAGYAADRVDDLKDRVDGNPASRPGPDVTDRLGYGSAGAAGTSAAANSLNRGESGVAWGAHEIADRADDLKDRVDGDPASRPGPDATDRAGYGTAGAGGLGGLGDRAGSLDRPGIGDDVQRAGDRVENTADDAWDSTKRGADRLGDKAENLWDRTKEGARNLADKVEDKVDDTKDRVDGNPASRPGPDATDRRF